MDNYPQKGYYILTKTSNKSGSEIQDIIYNENPLYLFMAEKLVEWFRPGLGSVVGATYPDQLDKISDIFISSKKDIPYLIPGIGTQGGDLEATIRILKKFDDISIHRINSSSAINYAYKFDNNSDYALSAVNALKRLNNEITGLVNNGK